MKRGFTIVELLVAMGLFGALLAASGIIFAAAVDAHRTAEATAEIARKLAAITDQLNADFRGLQKDCPMAIWFEVDPCDPCNPDVRHDQILFFADGDFQSYGYSPPLVGNTARVYYGQANIMDVDYQKDPPRNLEESYGEVDILARRQHIYYSDPCIIFPAITGITNFKDSFTSENNDWYEHDNISLSQWKTITNDPCYNNQIITTCFDNDPCVPGRPGIDFDNAETLHMLLAQGVGHFGIQGAYPVEGVLQWRPSQDPDGDGDETDSDFATSQGFGFYFKMPAGVNVDMTSDGTNDWIFVGSLPKALKFTFTLYDSKGVFKEGKTFTHIVYLDD